MRLAVVNLKGGVAKSTTAVYLACGLAGHGRTLLIDADPQGSALTWSEIADGLPAPVVALPIKDLHRRIDDVALGRDFVVIDTPPHNTAIVAGALRAADVAVTPIQPSMLDLNRLTSTIELVEEIR